MSEAGPSDDGSRRFDLEERTFRFAEQVRHFARRLPRTLCNIEDVPQVVRSSGSVGANYIEANEALSKKISDTACESRAEKQRSRDIGCDCFTPATIHSLSKCAPLSFKKASNLYSSCRRYSERAAKT